MVDAIGPMAAYVQNLIRERDELRAENERLLAWIKRTAYDQHLKRRGAGYHERRISLEAEAILNGKAVPEMEKSDE